MLSTPHGHITQYLETQFGKTIPGRSSILSLVRLALQVALRGRISQLAVLKYSVCASTGHKSMPRSNYHSLSFCHLLASFSFYRLYRAL